MKKILAAALLSTVLTGSSFAANPFHHHKKPDYRYHTPKYRYKAPKKHVHISHPHNNHHSN